MWGTHAVIIDDIQSLERFQLHPSGVSFDSSMCGQKANKQVRTMKKALLGGVVGTAMMTFMMYFVRPMLVGAPMDIAAEIGSREPLRTAAGRVGRACSNRGVRKNNDPHQSSA